MQNYSGIEYLKIDITNQFEAGRLIFPESIEWVNENESKLEQYTEQAKHPILYHKAVKAYRRAMKGEEVNHIMGLDASCSGMSIMGMLSGCESSINATNLGMDKLNHDAYMLGMQIMNDMLPKELNVEVPRADIKKAIMTALYSSKATPKKVFGAYKKSDVMLEAFWDMLSVLAPGPVELLDLFERKLWHEDYTFHTHTLIDGHTSRVPVISTVEKKIEVENRFGDKTSFTYATRVLAPTENAKPMAANLVHAEDAYLCRETVKRCFEKGVAVYPIHDCYYASPVHMNIVRKVYIDICTELTKANEVQRLCDVYSDGIMYSKLNNTMHVDVANSEYALT